MQLDKVHVFPNVHLNYTHNLLKIVILTDKREDYLHEVELTLFYFCNESLKMPLVYGCTSILKLTR